MNLEDALVAARRDSSRLDALALLAREDYDQSRALHVILTRGLVVRHFSSHGTQFSSLIHFGHLTTVLLSFSFL